MITGISATWNELIEVVSVYHFHFNASRPKASNSALIPRGRSAVPGANIHCQTTPVTTKDSAIGKR